MINKYIYIPLTLNAAKITSTTQACTNVASISLTRLLTEVELNNGIIIKGYNIGMTAAINIYAILCL